MKIFKTWGYFILFVCLTVRFVSADVVPAQDVSSMDLANGLEGYWTFDEMSGEILHDYSGHGYDGTLMNYPDGFGNWTSGQMGGALQFGGPGTDEYVRVPDFTMPTHSMTLTAWVLANSLPRWATVAANWNQGWGAFNYAIFGAKPKMSLYVAGKNRRGRVHPDHGVSSISLSLNRWHFVAFVADSQSGTVTFMQDGVVSGSFDYRGQLLASSPILNIGDDPSDTHPGRGNWDGKMDDLAIWSRALSCQELTDIYNAGLSGDALLTLLGPSIACSGAQKLECGVPATVVATVGDPLGASLDVLWMVDGIAVQTNTVPAGVPPTATNLSFTAELPLGTNLVEVSAMDSYANEADCSSTVTVVDTTSPVIESASAFPRILKPVNHKLVRVSINTVATDNCDIDPNWKVIDIQSSQPVSETGSSQTNQNWRILNDHNVALRAERSGKSERIYTLTLQAEDISSNLSAPKTVEVKVP